VSALGISSEENSRDPTKDDEGATPDETVVNEAKRRFARCSDWETDSRVTYIEDIKFDAADSDNLYQWSQTITTARGLGTVDERPCLTINKARQHNLQIINDAKQNKPSVKVKPVGNGATYDSALVYSAVCEHIEYISNAQQAYDTATGFQVRGGIGWWRIVTDYSGDDSFDQEIFIRRVKDPLTIYMDPDIREVDGSDAKFAFVFDDMTREDFNQAYPKYKDKATKSPLGVTDDWVGNDKVRIAEYYRVVEESDKLVAYLDPLSGQRVIERKSKLDKEMFISVSGDPETKLRDIVDRKVEWYLIVGNDIADRSVWPGKYIPLIRVIGEETIIEGKLDRKGHTRAMKDPQRMYNYWTSSAVEQVALQTKVPYVAALGAIEGLETYWETANSVNHSVLPYNHMDDAGREMPPPIRANPPSMASAYIEGMKISSQEIKEVTGQYEAELGMQGNEKSGVAIQQRQRQGDNATYHYIDNLAIGIKFTGKILIDLIPKIYDTPRIIKIMGDDGVENQVTVDTQANDVYSEKAVSKTVVQSIFNPSVGKYDVEAEIGPDNGTQRQEAFKALSQLMSNDKDLMKVGGDILVKMADFPMADVLAERLKRAVPPELLGEGPPPALIEAQNHMKTMTKEMQDMQDLVRKQSEALTQAKSQALVHQEQKDIDIFRAVTDRLKILLPLVTSPAEQLRMAHDIMMAEHTSDHAMLQASHSSVLGILQARAMPQPDNDAQPQQAAE
jgi:hypothetical protein